MPPIKMTSKPKFPTRKIYDTADAEFHGTTLDGEDIVADPETSLVANAPKALTVSDIPALTTAQVEAQLHPDGPWVEVGDVLAAEAKASLHVFDTPLNFVRVRRVSGTGAITAYVQD